MRSSIARQVTLKYNESMQVPDQRRSISGFSVRLIAYGMGLICASCQTASYIRQTTEDRNSRVEDFRFNHFIATQTQNSFLRRYIKNSCRLISPVGSQILFGEGSTDYWKYHVGGEPTRVDRDCDESKGSNYFILEGGRWLPIEPKSVRDVVICPPYLPQPTFHQCGGLSQFSLASR